MRILHVLSQRPDSTGSGIYVQGIIAQAARRGHENRLVAGVARGEEPEPACISRDCCHFVLFEDESLPFPVPGMTDVMPYRSSVFGTLSQEEIAAYQRAFAATLARAAREFSPDLVHCHHLWLAASVARREFPDLPVVATCHGTDLRQFRNCPHLRQAVLSGCRDLDMAMALSHAQRQDIIALYGLPPERVMVAGAGFAEDVFTPLGAPAPPPVKLLYAGKLTRPKGVIWMLRALDGLRHLPWTLDLVGGGEGPQAEEIKAFAAGFPGRSTLHGPLPQRELAKIMGRSHVFVLPSLFEGLPLVLLEALASGCRLVATALPGVAEIFGQATDASVALAPMPRLQGTDLPHPGAEEGFVADLGAALAGQIGAVLAGSVGPGEKARELIARFTWAGVFARVEAVYQDVLSRPRRPL